jgi:hypothetical protein
MARQYYVTLTVTPPNGDAMPPSELGEFHSTWNRGISIGSDAGCDVVLSGLAPVAAIVRAASNHKLLYRLGSPGFEQYYRERSTGRYTEIDGRIAPYDERVDYREFYVGDYVLQLGEAYRDEPKGRKKVRWLESLLNSANRRFKSTK